MRLPTWINALATLVLAVLTVLLTLDELGVRDFGPTPTPAPVPTVVVSPAPWDAREEYLLARLNPNLRPYCTQSEIGPSHALARLECDPETIATTAWYFLFEDVPDLRRYLRESRRRVHYWEYRRPCSRGSSTTYRYDIDLPEEDGGDVEDAGRILCFRAGGDGDFVLVWSQEDARALGWITASGDAHALFEWWQHGGGIFAPDVWD